MSRFELEWTDLFPRLRLPSASSSTGIRPTGRPVSNVSEIMRDTVGGDIMLVRIRQQHREADATIGYDGAAGR